MNSRANLVVKSIQRMTNITLGQSSISIWIAHITCTIGIIQVKSKANEVQNPIKTPTLHPDASDFRTCSSFPDVLSNTNWTRCNDNHQHLNLAQNPPRFVFLAPGLSGKSVVSASLSPYGDNGCCVRDAECTWLKGPWFLCGCAAPVPAAVWRAATTRRTITRGVGRVSICRHREKPKL